MVSLQGFGVKNSEKTLILVHAFPLSSAMYHDAVEELLRILPDLQIIIVDLPGFGAAPYHAQWTIAEAMADLHHQLKEQNISSVIIGGTSMGGYAAFAYYRLFKNEVSGLILSNTKAEADDDAAKRGREEYAQDIEHRGVHSVIERQLDKLVGITTRTKRKNIQDQVRHWIEASDPNAIAAALRAMAVRDDSTDLLARIVCPTLVISGSEDELMTPAVTSSISERISGSVYHEIPAAGHLTPLETPNEWAGIISAFRW